MTRSQISPEYLLFIVVPSSRNLLNYLTQSFISLRRSFYPGLKFKAILKLAPPMCPTCQGLTSGMCPMCPLCPMSPVCLTCQGLTSGMCPMCPLCPMSPMCLTCQGLTSGNTQYNLTERFLSIFINVGDSC